uniref:Uncharacterized protein n=1 Tax=Glossina palpalis gambiensis TaxID=67801 RepID=A0A1B0C1A2_9MUSC
MLKRNVQKDLIASTFCLSDSNSIAAADSSRGQLLKRTFTMAHNKSNKTKYYCRHPLNVAKLSIEENNITIIAIIIIIIPRSEILSLANNLEMLQIIK